MRFAVVIEKGPESFGASVPDLPGCVAVAESRDEAEQPIREVIELQIENLRDAGEVIPRASSSVPCVDVAA